MTHKQLATRNSQLGTHHPLFAGVDVGASRTKVVILDAEKRLLGHAVRKSGTDFTETAEKCLKASLKMTGALRKELAACVSTGYGRKNVLFSDETKTEIGCHAKGCYHYFPMAMTIIDIGARIIRLSSWTTRAGV